MTGQKQVVHLVITAEIEAGDNESNRYHVSLVRDFQELMKAVKGRQNKHFYCPTCLAGIDRPKVDEHVVHCSELAANGEAHTEILFYPPGYRRTFSVKLNSSPVQLLGSFDIETAQVAVDDRERLGPLTDCRSHLVPVSYAHYLGYNLGASNLPRLLPKCFIGKDIIAHFYEQLSLELCYLQCVLRKTRYPIHWSREEKAMRYRVTNCANCDVKFGGIGDVVAHHDHTRW